MKEILIREELKNRIIETSDKLLKDKVNFSIDKLNNLYNLFREKFGINKLKSLDGEELIKLFSLGNKDGLFYWLEFKNDEEFNTRTFGSIAGGSAFKYILFNRNKDNKWITGSPQNQRMLNDDEALVMIREIRDLLIKGSEIIKEEIEKEISLDSYRTIQNRLLTELKYNMGNLGWVHKYYHMIYPEYIDDFHSEYMKKYFLTCCGVNLNGNEKRYDMAGYLYFISKEVELPFNYLTSSMADIFGTIKEYISIKCSDNENIEKMKVLSYINVEEKLSEDLEADLNKINKLKKNDIIVIEKNNEVLGIAKYSGNYEYIENSKYPHTLNVEWIKIYDGSNSLSLNEKKTNGAVYFIKNLKSIMLIEEEIFGNTNKKYKVKDEIKMLPIKGLTLELDNILKRKKQVILYGPPGTGKTYNAEKISFELSSRNIFKRSFEFLNEEEKEIIKGNSENKGYVRFSCFHPNYSYEDFIEGIKPKVVNGQTVFEERDGVFKSICKDAQNNKDKNYYLIIDEINRGDISRIFGELIMLIEKSKRGKEIILPLSNTLFSVPDNLYIIGTMNTADRSISALDIALRRRFGFKELMTDYKLFEGIVFKSLPLDKWLKEFNNRIIENLGKEARNLQIGHSYFIENEKPISDIERFREIIKEDIIPLIDEYCYGDYSLMAKILGNSIINVKEQSVNEKLFEASNPLEFIEALIEPCIEIRIEDSVEDIDEYDNKEEISDEDTEIDRI